MRVFVLFLAFLSSTLGFSQVLKETLDSKKLNGTRSFTITLPPNYESNTDKKYPTLLLLDGEYLTGPFDGTLKYGNYWDDLPEMIIISLNQNYGEQRFLDSEFDEAGLPSGTGAKFFEFIGFELLPYVENKYRTNPYRVIAGHDITAGFLNFYLYKNTSIFNAYICLAPEFAPNMKKRIKERLTTINTPVTYYLATGESEIEELKDKTIALHNGITEISNKNINHKFDNFKNATHYSLVAKAIPAALYFIFDGYQPISMVEFENKIVKMDSGYTQYLIDKYKNIEDKLGLKIKPRLTDFQAIEAAILKNKAYTELQELSEFAEKSYPKTTLSIYHKALYYEKTGDYKKAFKEYNKAFDRVPIREISVDYMLERAEKIKNILQN